MVYKHPNTTREIISVFEFLYSTACRIGEVVKLNCDDINFSTNSVIVHGKGDKEREVYFNTRCTTWLKRYQDERDDEEPCLFITGKRLKRRIFLKWTILLW